MIGCFLVGVAIEVLVTSYTVSVTKRQRVPVALITFLITLCQLTFLAGIVSEGMPMARIIAYAAGNGLGAFIVMHWSHMKESKREDAKSS